MKRKFMPIIHRISIALFMALFLFSVFPGSASALGIDDYFLYSYDVQFSKTEITGSESFSATVTVDATCKKNLPLPVPVSEALISGRIVAENQASGTRVTLNSNYSLSISPFPGKAGETKSVGITIPLQFPSGSTSGNYSILAELTEARVKAIIWIDASGFLASEQAVNTVISYTAPAVSRGGGGGGGGGGGLAPSKVSVSGMSANNDLMVNNLGVVQASIRLQVTDADTFLDITEGTKLLDASGNPVTLLSARKETEPPAPAAGKAIVSAVDFGPDGTTFTPEIILAMNFDPASLPEGMAVEGLYIAYWDGTQWQALPSVLDIRFNRVSAKVSHFTEFAIIGSIPVEGSQAEQPPPETGNVTAPEPAIFDISALSIIPREMTGLKPVTVSALVTNSGGSRDRYRVVLKLNGEVVDERGLILDPGAEYRVSFEVTPQAFGTYEIDINGLTGSFTAREAAPEIVTTAAEPVVISEPETETSDELARPWYLN